MPVCWSMGSRNCPMTKGTLCMRLTSSCARRSSRFRFFCSSLIYSSCSSKNSRCRCSFLCLMKRSSSFSTLLASDAFSASSTLLGSYVRQTGYIVSVECFFPALRLPAAGKVASALQALPIHYAIQKLQAYRVARLQRRDANLLHDDPLHTLLSSSCTESAALAGSEWSILGQAEAG